MNDVLIPDWIKREKAEREQENARSEANTLRQLADSRLVKSEGPEFWRQLLRELAINTDALPEIGIRGSVSRSGDPEYEDRCRVSIVLNGLNPNQTYTDFFYVRGSAVIRCHTLEGEAFQLPFYVRPEGGIGIASDRHAMLVLMTPEKAAEVVVKRMADLVRQ